MSWKLEKILPNEPKVMDGEVIVDKTDGAVRARKPRLDAAEGPHLAGLPMLRKAACPVVR